MQLLDIRKISFLLLVFFGAIMIVSCGDDEPDPMTCETTGLTYSNFAKDFISNTCWGSGCHESGTMLTGEMSDYTSTKAWIDQGRVIKAINHEDGVSNMPKGEEKLDDCSISKLTAWINDGAPE